MVEIILVLVLIFSFETWLAAHAWRLASISPAEPLRPVGERLHADLERRAALGQCPEWSGYRMALERPFALLDERLRLLASAALALGMGGTILAVVVHLHKGGSDTFIQSLPLALVGSLLGVFVHLVITLWLLPRVETSFEEQIGRQLEELELASEERPPVETLLRGLERIPIMVAELLKTSISEALIGLPPVVEGLGEKLVELAAVTQAQGSEVSEIAEVVRESSRAVAESARLLGPGVESLNRGIAQLEAFPQSLEATLSLERDNWSDTLRRQHEKRWSQLVELIDLSRTAANNHHQTLQASIGEAKTAIQEVREALQTLPERLGQGVADLAAGYGNTFGAEARHHIGDLREELSREREATRQHIEKHEQIWRNHIGEVVVELIQTATQPIRTDLIPSLEEVGRELSRGSQSIGGEVKRFVRTHEEWRRGQTETLTEYRRVSRRLEGVAKVLAEGEDELSGAIRRLGTRVDEALKMRASSVELANTQSTTGG